MAKALVRFLETSIHKNKKEKQNDRVELPDERTGDGRNKHVRAVNEFFDFFDRCR